MTNQVNNNLLANNTSQNQRQVFDVVLNEESINSLQQSINNLAAQLGTSTQATNTTTNTQNSTTSTTNTNASNTATSNVTSGSGFAVDPNTGEIIFIGGNNPTTGFNGNNGNNGVNNGNTNTTQETIKAKSRIAEFNVDKATRNSNNGNRRPVVSNQPERSTQAVQVPLFERQPIGSTARLADGSTVETYKNDDGTTTEVTIKPDGKTTTKTFEDFPLDNNGNPTGFRTTIVEDNGSVTVLTTVINDLGDGNFSSVTTDITDSSRPVHATSSAMHASEALDDDGNIVYNSSTSTASGFQETVDHEKIDFDDTNGLDRPSGYRSTYSQRNANGTSSTSITETISYTDENGQRLTIVFDVTDPSNIRELSRSTRPDPMTSAKATGTEISEYLDKVNQYGLLDITGDGSLDPMSDLILIYRYLQGQRGAALTQNINLGTNPRTTAQIEEKINTALNRGLFDVNGSDNGNDVYEDDLKILARYMMGARGEVLIDGKAADDDSIKIEEDGSNVLSVSSNSPLLSEIQEIFGVDGKQLELTTNNGSRQNYNLFFVNTETKNTTGFVGRSPQNGTGSYRRY